MSDDLYRLPLTEFTAARDALAKRLTAEGRKVEAAEVKLLRKPSVAAWAANQVVWRFPDLWTRLCDATAALRRAHEKASSSEPLREAAREQREALRESEARAAEQLEQQGHAATPAVLASVSRTLQALASGIPGTQPGRLDSELQPPGFEALTGLFSAAPALASDTAALRALPEPAPKPAPASQRPAARQAQAKEAPPAAEAAREAAAETAREKARLQEEQRREQRRLALAVAAERQAQSAGALTTARSRAEDAEERVVALERELAQARERRDEARRALQAAEREQARTAAALEQLKAGG